MKLIYHDESEPLSYDKVYKGCQEAYGVKRPDMISGFMGFFFRVPDVYVYGKLEKWAENNAKVEEELKVFIKRYMAQDYGFVTSDEHDLNTENRWLCGSTSWTIARYSFENEELQHRGGIVLEFLRDFGVMYSFEEDMKQFYSQYCDDPDQESEVQYVSYSEIRRRKEEKHRPI